VIAHVRRDGRVLVTRAISDARFADLDSVRRNEIEAVIVAPIGSRPIKGIVYVQGRKGGELGSLDVKRTEQFARVLETAVARILECDRITTALARNAGNVKATADELGMSRSRLYELLQRLHIHR
jgi:DNA-binding NtrC family response regulator